MLRELEGLETAEVARSLRISTITVRRHLFRARRRLRTSLSALEEKKSPIKEMKSLKSFSKPLRGSYKNMKINAPFVEKVLTKFIREELLKET